MTINADKLVKLLGELRPKHGLFCNRFKCDCGADEHNASIDAAIAELGREDGREATGALPAGIRGNSLGESFPPLGAPTTGTRAGMLNALADALRPFITEDFDQADQANAASVLQAYDLGYLAAAKLPESQDKTKGGV